MNVLVEVFERLSVMGHVKDKVERVAPVPLLNHVVVEAHCQFQWKVSDVTNGENVKTRMMLCQVSLRLKIGANEYKC